MTMRQIDTNRIKSVLSEDFGINLNVLTTLQGLEIRPIDLEFGQGFTLLVKTEWRNLTAEFIPDNFAGTLLRTMSLANPSKKEIFHNLMKGYTSFYSEVNLKINGKLLSSLDSTFLDDNWFNLYIKLLKFPVIQDEITVQEFEDVILKITGDILGLILSLLPLEENLVDESISGLPEGALTRVEVNKYERSPFNRQACLRIHGSTCKTCGFDFEKKYGLLGKGFIHVHHIVPVSKIGPNYLVNPATELVPVCPNCHAMIHKKNPPYTVEELKSIISSNIEVSKGC